MSTWSAPGKLLLLGEHAVVYGYPCLVTSVNQRMEVCIECHTEQTRVETTSNNTRFVDSALEKGKQKWGGEKMNFLLKIQQSFSSQFGFGSSSAVTVATLAALADCLDYTPSQQELFELSLEVVREVQGIASGFDVASAVFGHTIWYSHTGKDIQPVSLEMEQVSLLVGYSGTKADTTTLVRQVETFYKNHQEEGNTIFEDIQELVFQGRQAIEKKDWQTVGELLTANHRYLQKLSVSTDRLDVLVDASLQAGAYGAKLSGAGGGDCMIALVPFEKVDDVQQAIQQHGGTVMDISINAEGVKRS